ncbi:hypothetical protein [Bacillus phage YungSlug]|nr:hypothetical protein [Bacillus phage YungSlug]
MEFEKKNFKPTVEEKREFIKWVLNNLKLAKREMSWILNYLLSHNSLVEKVHFVEKGALKTPKGMILCAKNYSDEEYNSSFVYIKHNCVSGDCEKAFHDVRLNRDEDVYIEIIAGDLFKNESYVSAIEENPYYKDGNEKILGFTDAVQLKFFLDHMEAIARQQQIDFLLEKRDFATLEKLIKKEVRECTEKELEF